MAGRWFYHLCILTVGSPDTFCEEYDFSFFLFFSEIYSIVNMFKEVKWRKGPWWGKKAGVNEKLGPTVTGHLRFTLQEGM